MKVNLLCLAGAAMGLLSLFFPWWQGSDLGLGLMIDRDYMLVQDVLFDSTAFGSLFMVACTMYVVGTFLAFWSPLGGLVQVPGVLGFLAMFGSEVGVRRGEDTIALGAYLGLVSMIVVVISLLVPLGVGYSLERRGRKRSLSSPGKFFTVSWYGEGDRVRLNVLALCGALLAFVCIALPWSTESTTDPAPDMVLEERPLFSYLWGDLAHPSSYVFIIGSAIAVATTLGVLVQMFGFVWFWAAFAGTMGTYPGMEEAFGAGFYLSVLPMLATASSMVLPIGLGYYRRKKSAGSRLFVWGKAGPRAY